MNSLQDLRKGVEVNRNRDTSWVRALERKSAERRIGVWARLSDEDEALTLSLTDEDGHSASAQTPLPDNARQRLKDTDSGLKNLREHIGKMGNTIFDLIDLQLSLAHPWFIPAALINPLRREAVTALEAARSRAWVRLERAMPLEPPVRYPHSSLSYLGNVLNHKAHAFYARHGVEIIAPAFEALQETGDVSLMITKHCVRYSLSLCPKQAKGVTGVQGTVKAEPLQLINGKERLTLRFDCKACEMHVVGHIKPALLRPAQPAQA